MLADLVAAHLDTAALHRLIEDGPVPGLPALVTSLATRLRSAPWISPPWPSNLNITPHEEWWRQCVKPLLQSLSIREPLPMLKSGDYSAFRRNFPSLPVPDYLREHVPSNLVSVGDLSGILREIEFDDSRQQVGLQIADALTNCVRRALIGNVQADGWRHVRKLMIRRRGGAVKFISMGSGGPIRERPYGLVAKMLAEGHRSMLTERRRRSSGAPWSRGAGRA